MITSRRKFLKQSGLGIVAARFGWLPRQAVIFPARAFGLTPVYKSPNEAVIGHLIENSVHQVRSADDWFVVAHGYVDRTAMQPISQYPKQNLERWPIAPFWAELIAPSSLIREYASGDAPIVDTFGQGAVVRVSGTLGRNPVWLEIEGGGWGIGEHFSAWDSTQAEETPFTALKCRAIPKNSPCIARHFNAVTLCDLFIQINLREKMLRLYVDQSICGQAQFYGASGIERGTTVLGAVSPGGERGAPWQMITESGVRVYGVYWHNRFGLAGDEADLHLPIETAKMIYALVRTMRCTVSIE